MNAPIQLEDILKLAHQDVVEKLENIVTTEMLKKGNRGFVDIKPVVNEAAKIWSDAYADLFANAVSSRVDKILANIGRD